MNFNNYIDFSFKFTLNDHDFNFSFNIPFEFILIIAIIFLTAKILKESYKIKGKLDLADLIFAISILLSVLVIFMINNF